MHLFKKYKIIWMFLFLIICFLIFFNKDIPLATFKSIENNKVLNEDLNGDGNKDAIYIKTNDNEYLIQINLNNKGSLSLNPNSKIKTLGEHKNYWPIKVTFKDISRDNCKEIFLQSSFNETPIQHMFLFDGEKYVNALSEKYNIIGFLDSSNGKTPKIISGNFKNVDSILNSYILVDNTLKKFDYSYPNNYIGNELITDFLSFIESFPNDDVIIPKYFNEKLSGDTLTNVYKLAYNETKYIFQDGFFEDISYDDKGNPIELRWVLNFKGLKNNNYDDMKNYTIELILSRSIINDNNYNYNITSLDINSF